MVEPNPPSDRTVDAKSSCAHDACAHDDLRRRLANSHALLSRTDLAKLGWPRRGIDAIYRQLPVVAVPGFARPMIKVADYLTLLESSTYRDDRLRPNASARSCGYLGGDK
jgi:hypothetical protein